MASNGALPLSIPNIPADQKFDGGYINGTITNPTITTAPNHPDPTPVYSIMPSREEWVF
ncbi:hypothetical protein GYMLUDRAFT_242348 [Collybiopsis luxurians FD-317 M1]|uniref:Uncharacterized protein n=1 Tax=Collybiopsis luxurians FD-317 M1 TaxID=944289 RepID=A0A0D0C3J7_9AGAR|nr:hypothetical protein GYMLUDRAFT_242348 [Collybiopsis luxurians FD-317 M1]